MLNNKLELADIKNILGRIDYVNVEYSRKAHIFQAKNSLGELREFISVYLKEENRIYLLAMIDAETYEKIIVGKIKTIGVKAIYKDNLYIVLDYINSVR